MKTAGIVLLTLGGLLALMVPVGMWSTVRGIATSSTAPTPQDLANGIATSRLFGLAAVPVALLGLACLMIGLYVSRDDPP